MTLRSCIVRKTSYEMWSTCWIKSTGRKWLMAKKYQLWHIMEKCTTILVVMIDYSMWNKLKFTMYNYIYKLINELPEDIKEIATSPWSSNLFEVNGQSPLLNEEDVELFHHLVAKTLFLLKQAWPDLQTAVAFLLCTRIQAPTKDDWHKLTHMMKHFQNTWSLPLILEYDDTRIVKWHIDRSFLVHNDMKSHSRIYMTTSKGVTYAASTKQKLVVKSSTEAELIAVNNGIPDSLDKILSGGSRLPNEPKHTISRQLI